MPVCVEPSRNPNFWFSHAQAHITSIFNFTETWNDSSLFESRDVGSGTQPSREAFENMPQPYTSSFDIPHSESFANDMAHVNVNAHSSTEQNLNGDNAGDDLGIKDVPSISPDLESSGKTPKKVPQHHTTKRVKRIHTRKVRDTKSHLKAKLEAHRQAQKHDTLNKIEIAIKEEPTETEPYHEQDSKDIDLLKQESDEDTDSYTCKTDEETFSDEPIGEDIDSQEPNTPETPEGTIKEKLKGHKRKSGSKDKVDTKSPKTKKSDKDSVIANVYCNMCEHTFTSQRRYDNHLTKDRCKHVCEFCGKIFLHRTTYLYKLHVKYHKKEKDQECGICGKLFVSRGEMLTHVKHHTVPKSRIVCEICGLSYGTRQSLLLHKNNTHNDNREKLLCPNCPRMFMSPAGLSYHMQTKHDEGNVFNFPCSVCGKICKEKKLLKAHMISHQDTRDFKCEICPAVFKTMAYLNLHKKRHEKAFVCFCQYCQKGFYEAKALREHENTHTGAKPYACSFCDYTCANRANLRKHEKLVHKK